MSDKAEEVRITIDGVELRVPRGTNLIAAAARVGIEIPHYCYHPHLSIAGNCRMCQVRVEGSPKLTIACNTGATDGMVVSTQRTSPEVADAQRATLEFLLINHPLDCTVCDQAGHCKLQDYYYEYNTKASRFTEDKVEKVKAEVLGPEVIYDGERCILCTRCVRFCDEVTQTHELGMFNRGDRSVIGVHPGVELNNPLSGTVVDLCPVGALTHRRWRFNTRIWYSKKEDSVCAGCSTGCNAEVYMRDNNIVHVKARLNSEVNKEWMCDEGRYGFERFQPETRFLSPKVRNGAELHDVTVAEAFSASSALTQELSAAMFLSPLLTLEEQWVAAKFASSVLKITPESGNLAVQIRKRTLSKEQAVLISPDYAPNARAVQFCGIETGGVNWRDTLQARYVGLLERVRRGEFSKIVFVGDLSVLPDDIDEAFCSAVSNAKVSLSLQSGIHRNACCNGAPKRSLADIASVVLPTLTVNEKNGVFVNGSMRFQRIKALLSAPAGVRSEWESLANLAAALKISILPEGITDDRALFRHVVASTPAMAGLSLMKLGAHGVSLGELGAFSTDSFQAEVGRV